MIVAGRLPANDLPAETAVLSAAMLQPTCVGEIGFLRPEHFYNAHNGAIYKVILELIAANQPIDLVTIGGELRRRERLAEVGGAAYIAQIADASPHLANVQAHAQRVWECWRIRTLVAHCQTTAAEGYGDVGDIQEWIDQAAQFASELATRPGQNPTLLLRDALGTAMKALFDAAERGERITGTSTGFEKLDARIAGLHDGDLTIVAGRPGQGKTSLATGMAVNVAAPRVGSDGATGPVGDGVAIFSLEMPRDQIAIRMVCSEARVDLGKVRQGFLQPDDWTRLAASASFLSSLPIWIDDTPALSLVELRAKLRKIQANYDRPATAAAPRRRVGLAIIDYIQLMKGSGGKMQSREQEIAEVSRGLKQLAKDMRIPVIALAQLNRGVESRADKRPQLSDLRESGSLEQDADNVLLVYRAEHYFPDKPDVMKGIAELIIGKQRNGPTGKVLLRFWATCTRFDNLAGEDYPDLLDDD